ncbi:MAG: PKD domain-containing protein [Flavobacteriales bacterium]|nr:PKD domain-containing protein [Flavobacteriales bacterium]MCB9448356.1 PKD domain-containing protein [Flavobacteriales bacterium]
MKNLFAWKRMCTGLFSLLILGFGFMAHAQNPDKACKLKARFDFKVDSCKVTFADLSLAGAGTTITNWYWDFGDGTTSLLQNPTHVYTFSGAYNVCLTIVGVNAAGERCKDQFCARVQVNGCGFNLPCKLKARFGVKDSCLTANFTDFSLSGLGTTITAWYWDFGDGGTSTLQNPTHVYGATGVYNVCLTIVGVNPNGQQCKDQYCAKVKVKDCGQTEPCRLLSRFKFRDSCLTVNFLDASLAGAGTTITSWYWNFGDGGTSTLQNPTHTYPGTGVYNVCLTIVGVNAAGQYCRDQYCVNVKVKDCGQNEPCVVFPRFKLIDSCLTVNFYDGSTAGTGTTITNWYWNFGDGGTSTLQNPMHTYGAAGVYNVCLTIVGVNVDGTQCKDQICIPVTVKDCGKPCEVYPRFQWADSCLTVNFLDFSAAGAGTTITNWYWNFGDGGTSTLQNPVHTFPAAGTYNVCLIVVGMNADSVRCKNELCLDVTVKDCGNEPCAVYPKFDWRDSCLTVNFLDFSAAGIGTTITSWFWDFGDGGTSTLQNPMHTFPVAGTYTVCLTVVGTNPLTATECKDRLCLQVTVKDCGNEPCAVYPRFDWRDSCLTVNFLDFSAAGAGTTITNWYWNFGDGGTSTLQNPMHTFPAAGTYTVCLTVVGTNPQTATECKNQLCLQVTVKDCGNPPCEVYPRFQWADSCLTVNFLDFSAAGPGTTITDWYWNFGDGGTSTLQNPMHTFPAAGTYKVCLTVVGINADSVRCKNELCLDVTVKDCSNDCVVHARFAYGAHCLTVNFTDNSAADPGTVITSWFWDFGDGNTSTLQNPSHTYAAGGTYTVCLKVAGVSADGSQCEDKICGTILVQPCDQDTCAVYPRFDWQDSCLTVNFTDYSVTGPGTGITNWYWSFGDGSTSTLQNPTHTFPAAGTYKVCLAVVGMNADSMQCKNELCMDVTVKDCGNEPCTLMPKFDWKDSCLMVLFVDGSLSGPGTTITSWNWSFGDGGTSSLQNPTHVYAVAGTYKVCLGIAGVSTDGTQCRDEVCMEVTVKDCGNEPCSLVPRFDWKDSCQTVSFIDLSAFGVGTVITNWYWDFGDGGTSTLQNPTHAYVSPGVYVVCLTIVGVTADGNQCKDQVCTQVVVNPCDNGGCIVVPKFGLKRDSCTVSFVDLSTTAPGTIIGSWNWDFGDGGTSNVQNPTHTYAASGTYVVCLEVSGVTADGTQCRDKICEAITVLCDSADPQIRPIRKMNLSSLEVFPNPATNQAQVRFLVAEEGAVNITVYDMQGRVLDVLQNGNMTAGAHSIDWKVSVPPGVYMVTVRTEVSIERKQVVIR